MKLLRSWLGAACAAALVLCLLGAALAQDVFPPPPVAPAPSGGGVLELVGRIEGIVVAATFLVGLAALGVQTWRLARADKAKTLLQAAGEVAIAVAEAAMIRGQKAGVNMDAVKRKGAALAESSGVGDVLRQEVFAVTKSERKVVDRDGNFVAPPPAVARRPDGLPKLLLPLAVALTLASGCTCGAVRSALERLDRDLETVARNVATLDEAQDPKASYGPEDRAKVETLGAETQRSIGAARATVRTALEATR